MNELIINFSGVTKIYNIRERGYRSLRDSLSGSLSTVLHKVARKNRNNLLSDTNSDMIYALKDVSFDVKKGETLGIIGVNGSGKTTILRLLANVTNPSSGNISIKGRVAPLIQVGAGFHPELTGKENVYLNATIMGMNKEKIDKKYDDIVSFAELERFMDTPVKRYSSGMYVRLGFAVIAHIDPDILLIDEILSVGDVNFRRKCIKIMDKFRESGKSIVFISHNMFSIESISDRVLVLNNGEISYMGKPADAIMFYENSVIGGIKGSLTPDGRQMNTEGFIIKNVSVLNKYDQLVDKIIINDPLKIKVDWETSQRVQKPTVDFHLYRYDGTRVCVERSNYKGCFFDPFEGHGTVIINIKKLALKRGEYTVAVEISDLNFHTAMPIAYHKECSFFVEDNVSAISEGFVSLDVEWSELVS
ncbi:MAG: ABC transporter ATP-binding protein [Bacteroidetes bacterium]|nr:ABC transporter ATP-binding protein [Bacteroidota bacterium]